MKRQMSIEQRLREYAEWLRQPGLHCGSGTSIFHRIQDEKHNAGVRSDGIAHELLVVDGEAVSCRPDGGMSRMVERMGRQIARDNRCREIHELVRCLPPHHRTVLQATYGGPEPRSVRVAAELLGVSKGRYCERKAALVAWFEGAMYRVVAVEAG